MKRDPQQIVAELRDALKTLNSEERLEVLEPLKEAFCMKCGGEGGYGCYCDYTTPDGWD